jgi:hypothetical protein
VIDALTIAHLGSAFLVLLVTGLMAAGFVRLSWYARGLIRHLAIGILTVHLAVFLRTLYRDVAPLIFDGGSLIFSDTGVLAVALVLNALIALAGYHGLKALYLAIPKEARARYSLLTAALYPPLRRS